MLNFGCGFVLAVLAVALWREAQTKVIASKNIRVPSAEQLLDALGALAV